MDYSSLQGRRVFTGGLGFIGSNLAIRLVELGCQINLEDSLISKGGSNLFNIDPVRDSALRLTNTYGPRMRVMDVRQTFPGIWLRQVIDGKPRVVYGCCEQLRDFNFVDDAVTAPLLSAVDRRAEGEVLNLGGKERSSLADLARLVLECAGGGGFQIEPFPQERMAIDIGDYFGDYF